MKPQDYSARTAYRPPSGWYRRLNWLGVLLTSVGFAPRDAVTLEVRGRRSGKIRRVPILRTRFTARTISSRSPASHSGSGTSGLLRAMR